MNRRKLKLKDHKKKTCPVRELKFLDGEEASFIVVTDGTNILPMATSQDHKARDEGDVGPNTGGMGAYSPAPVVTPDIEQKIMDLVIRPTLEGMKADGNNYVGFLYAGLMIMADGTPKVIEFNCRMGDPETQPIMARLNSDLVAICNATLDGTLGNQQAEWDSRASLGVVMAAGGYPESYAKGKSISGLGDANSDSQKVFHAGTERGDDDVVTSGGRVLCVVGLGDTVAEAAGTTANELDSPLEKLARDVRVIRQHVTVAPSLIDDGGRVLLGLEPESVILKVFR